MEKKAKNKIDLAPGESKRPQTLTRNDRENPLSTIGNLIFLLDRDQRIQYINPSALYPFELCAEPVVGKFCYQIFHHRDQPINTCPYQRMLTTLREETAAIMDGNGDRFHQMTVYPVLDNQGQLQYSIHTVQNLTLPCQAQRCIRERDVPHEQVWQSAGECLAMVNTDGDLVYVNPAWQRNLGWSDDEIQLHCWLELVHSEDRTEASQAWDHIRHQGKDYALAIRCRGKDGSYRRRSWFFTPTNQSNQFIIMVRDYCCSQRVKSYDRERFQYLQQMNSELKTMLQIIVHDLRTPLVNVAGYTSLLMEESELTAQLCQHMDHQACSVQFNSVREAMNAYRATINHNINQMERILKKVSTLLQVGQLELGCQSVSMNALIQDVLESLNLQIEQSQVQIQVNALPDIMGDELLLHHLFNNLISNAIKYQHPERRPVIQISGRSRLDHVSYFVLDNGRGISRQECRKIFELFYRADSNQKSSGGGIGLAIAQNIAHRHLGKIRVRSQIGEGSLFVVSLPCVGNRHPKNN